MKPARPGWGYFQEEFDAVVAYAVASLGKAGVDLNDVMIPDLPCEYQTVRRLADEIKAGRFAGVVVFCREPGLWCCVANKVAGVRAAPANTVAQVRRALDGLAANWIAVEMPGRTYYEVRQILRTCAVRIPAPVPPDLNRVIRDLEGNRRARR